MKTRQQIYYYDSWLTLAIGSLLAIGLLLLASASMGISGQFYHQPFYFLCRQTIYLVAGILIFWLTKAVPLEFWQRYRALLLLLSYFALFLVLIPGIGHSVNGSRRWIRLGLISLQMSELAKFAILIFIAGYLAQQTTEVRSKFIGFIKPLIIIGIAGVLLICEPDFGALVVMTVTTLGMIYLSGAKTYQFILFLSLVLLSLIALAVVSPYRMLRLTSFLNPWEHSLTSGYQLVQSLIAFGRGGIFGVGLGNSIQKLFYLPEAHTDFLFAILAEEFGIFGQLAVISLFVLLVARAFYIGTLAARGKNFFATYLAYGIGIMFGLQTIINIGVNVGLLPTKGLTLPFMSYGGSSMLFNCTGSALLFRIYHELMLNRAFLPKNYFLTTTIRRK